MPSKNHDEKGRFIPDPTPIEVPLALRQGETEAMRIARAVSLEFSNQAEKNGFETWEESQDFDVEDEWELFPESEFEIKEMQEEFLMDEPAPEEKTVEERNIEALEDEQKKPKEAEQSEREVPTDTR
jgi:hypothetical protein